MIIQDDALLAKLDNAFLIKIIKLLDAEVLSLRAEVLRLRLLKGP